MNTAFSIKLNPVAFFFSTTLLQMAYCLFRSNGVLFSQFFSRTLRMFYVIFFLVFDSGRVCFWLRFGFPGWWPTPPLTFSLEYSVFPSHQSFFTTSHLEKPAYSV